MQDIDLDMVRQRIAQLQAAKGLSARELSLRAKLNADTLGKFLAGKTQSLKANTLGQIARALGVNESFLMGSSDDAEAIEPPLGVRYGGVVEAGAFRPDPDGGLNQDDALRTVPIPADRRYPLSAQYAFRVVGDSMTEAHIFEGMWVLAVDVHLWERMHGEPGDGKLVVVARTRSGNPERELTVKRLRIFRDRVELQPQSTNTTHKPIVFPLPAREDEPAEAAIIAVVVASTWLYG